MSKWYPDVPGFLRITDQESKPPTHFSWKPTNPKNHEWTEEEKKLLVQMRDQGKTFGEIALAIGNGVSANQCDSVYHNMEERGELQIYEKIVLQGEEG